MKKVEKYLQQMGKLKVSEQKRLQIFGKKRLAIAEKKAGSISEDCMICFSPIGTNAYARCSTTHFCCTDCISGLVNNALAPGNIEKFKRHNGVFCYICDSSFDIPQLRQANISDVDLNKVVSLREDIAEARGQAIVGISSNIVNDHILRSKVEAIFFIGCPMCKTPIADDFADESNELHSCAALYCKPCKMSFCGICGMDCSQGAGAPDGNNDAHWHVMNCKYNMNPFEGVGTALHKNMTVKKIQLEEGRKLLFKDRLGELMETEKVSNETVKSVASDLIADIV
jgi:hypothetical protein